MTKFCVFTPTRCPGFDVSWASVQRQLLLPGDELLWLVADEIKERKLPKEIECDGGAGFVKQIRVPFDKGNARNLARAYNCGMEIAREWQADIFVSLQDYIWAPREGLQMFAADAVNAAKMGHEDILLTGYTDISDDPYVDEVVNHLASWTIFAEPYTSKPEVIGWEDVRRQNPDGFPPDQVRSVPPVAWETNWAAIPQAALYDVRLRFDEEYDRAVAYENQGYAYMAESCGYLILLDPKNGAISLPHKKYWPELEAYEAPLTTVNRKLTEQRYGS